MTKPLFSTWIGDLLIIIGISIASISWTIGWWKFIFPYVYAPIAGVLYLLVGVAVGFLLGIIREKNQGA